MFKLLHPTFFVVPVAWLTIAVLALIDAATPALSSLGVTPRLSWAVLAVQAFATLLFVTPVWRILWKIFPRLNRWFFPDLNGDWDVDVATNWPRIDATLKAANGDAPPINTRSAPEDQLPELGSLRMRARIKQTWGTISMHLWNPAGGGPIKESKTLSVQPFRGDEGCHGLAYVFEQENISNIVTDDRKFLGAVRIMLSRDDDAVLTGQMWSDRMWRRGMNTAGELVFSRHGHSKPEGAPREQKKSRAERKKARTDVL